MVLPGPGLLLVLAGIVTLSHQFTWAQRLVGPVRSRAMQAAKESVASPWRIAGSALVGVVFIALGIVWALVPTLPFGGVATGSSLIISGVAILALLVYSRRLVQQERAGGARPA